MSGGGEPVRAAGASTRCPHSDLDFNIHHTGMADSNVGSIAISAKCKICGVAMRLDRGLSLGASSRGPSRDSDPGREGGILVPVIADGEECDKEWGFFLTRSVVGG